MRRGLLTLFGFVGLVALVAAVSMVWLVLQEPVMVADAVSTGEYRPLLMTLTGEIGRLCRTLAGLL